MSDHGLEDLYRRYHGPKERGFTRLSDTVHTRIDRMYVQSRQSEWRWTRMEHSASAMAGVRLRSDHAAIVATLEVAPKRERKPTHTRIDPSIMRKPEVGT